MTGNEKTKEQAERQWARDTAQMEKRFQNEWDVSPGDPIRQEQWADGLKQRISQVSNPRTPPKETYPGVVELYAAAVLWARCCLLPRVTSSPHQLIFECTHDLEEDLREERWGEHTLLFPSWAPIQEEKPSLDSAAITNREWRKWMDNMAYWLENRSDAYTISERMAEQVPDLPAYTQDQVVQNLYCVSVCIAAAAWTRGEQVIRKHGAHLPQSEGDQEE